MRESVAIREKALADDRSDLGAHPWLAGTKLLAARQVHGNSMRGELRRDEPMSRHTSWRAGGRADLAYLPVDLDDLVACLRALPAHEPVLMVGLGSNLLVRDGGLRGAVILTHRALREIGLGAAIAGGAEIHAQAGV